MLKEIPDYKPVVNLKSKITSWIKDEFKFISPKKFVYTPPKTFYSQRLSDKFARHSGFSHY
jgi:hypothetical protein